MLQTLCAEQGINVSNYVVVPPERYNPTGFNIVVALGDDAAARTVPGWVGTTSERRGYLFQGHGGAKVLVSISPTVAATQWVPWRALLGYDLRRAKAESLSPVLERPTRNVAILNSPYEVSEAMEKIRSAGKVAFDIEISDSRTITCVGFAISPEEAYVFPAPLLSHAAKILEDPSITKITQNGQFDIHFLATRCGIFVQGTLEDTLVAWHSCYPELAGYSTNAEGGREKKRNKKTHKSLKFFASLFTRDEWWKNYDTDMHGMFVLNGKDCCITYEVMEKLQEIINALGVQKIYRHTMSLIPVCVAFQARGLRINDTLRVARMEAITEKIEDDSKRLEELAMPLILDNLHRLPPNVRKLFETRKVCACCGNGSKKRPACWSCAGFPKAPTKKQLAEANIELGVCETCKGEGEFFTYAFNGISTQQKIALLYDILHLPKRFKNKKLTTDEDALKGLLAFVA